MARTQFGESVTRASEWVCGSSISEGRALRMSNGFAALENATLSTKLVPLDAFPFSSRSGSEAAVGSR